MLRAQYILIAGAVLLIAALAFLPKSVVKNNNKTIEQTAQTENAAGESDKKVEEMHKAELTEQQAASLDKLKQQFHTAKADQKENALDQLIAAFREVNLYDSAAGYAALYALEAPENKNLVKAGDAYYDAFRLAMSKEKQKMLNEKARSYYQKVLEKEPELLDVKTKLGMTYVASETPMQGVTMIREVLAKDPNNEFAIKSLGLLSVESGQFDKAVDRFKQLLSINPDDMEGHFYLAVSYMELGRKKEAMEEFELVRKNSKDANILAAVDNYLNQLKK